MDLALAKARAFVGATSPNPPVGAVALSESGAVLAIEAHEKAGTLHAEAKVIENLKSLKILEKAHTLYVTLEPCNHTGRTPPCTEAILASGFKHVVYGAKDPNPRVAGSGAEYLQSKGIQVSFLSERAEECARLIAPFSKWVKTGVPFVVVKTAHQASGSMIPPKGQKTFTSQESLKFVHGLRKQSDAIMSASGTILSDIPEFTVRHVPDFKDKRRWLVIFDRRDRVPDEYLEMASSLGFQVKMGQSIEEELRFLGSQGVHQVLVEACATFSNAVIQGGFADEHIQIHQKENGPDVIEILSTR